MLENLMMMMMMMMMMIQDEKEVSPMANIKQIIIQYVQNV